jgi:osmotically-inducible protein OsmY
MADRQYGRNRRDDWDEEGRRERDRTDDRGFMERSADEVRSWFGDDDAERRRRMDDRGEEGGRPRRGGQEAYTSGMGRYGEDRYGQRGYREGGETDWRTRSREGSGSIGREEEGGAGRERGSRGIFAEYDRDRYDRGRGDEAESWSGRAAGRRSESPETMSWSYTEVWLIPGPYTGRGPRGYQRSDERIQEDVSERLMQHGRLDASDIEVQVANGEVTLTGNVRTREEKRHAEDVAESVSGVQHVQNQLRVSERSSARPLAEGERSQKDRKEQGSESRQSGGRSDRKPGSA